MFGAPEHENRTQTANVRQREDAIPWPLVPCTRVKIRIDHFPDSGELDFSLIAWDHPGSRLLANDIWANYDKWHAGMAAADLVAHIYAILKIEPDPFP